MKEFVISEAKAETAILVGLITKEQDEAKTKEYLDELEFLADTAGAVTVKRFTQKVGGPSQTTYVGSGKLQEIRQYIKQCQDAYDDWLNAQDASLFAEGLLDETNAPQPVGMVIFDDELSAKQLEGNLQLIADTLKFTEDDILLPFSAETGSGKEDCWEVVCDTLEVEMPQLR